MYARFTDQEDVCLEPHYKPKTNVDEVHEDIVDIVEQAATNLRGHETISHENTYQEADNRRQASPEVEYALRQDIVKVRQMLFFKVAAVVVTFLIAAAVLISVIMMTMSQTAPTAPKHVTTVQGK